MNNLTIIKKFGELMVDSREVAEMIAREHSNLMRDIRGYVSILENSKMNSQNFFIPSTYKAEGNNKTYDCYLLTRKGCDLAANKMTGEKGILFTAEYVTKFEEMENQSKANIPQLSKEVQAIFVLDERTVRIENRMDKFEDNMPLFNVECKELQALVRKIGIKALGGYKTPAYNDNSVRTKVYKDIQHQLKREFGIERYEGIKRVQLDAAKAIVNDYKVPMFLVKEIEIINDQIRF